MSHLQITTPHIYRAIVPCAGLGVRMRPMTFAIPKEMLPVGRKPVLEYIVEELRDAGITDILFIITPQKEMIRTYFGDGFRWGINCDYVIKREPRGPGYSILLGERWTQGKPFVVALGDCLLRLRRDHSIVDWRSPLQRMLDLHGQQQPAVIVLTEVLSVKRVLEQPRRYTILAEPNQSAAIPELTFPFIYRLIPEKDLDRYPPQTPVLVSAARWILSPAIFSYLRILLERQQGEVHLPAAVAAMTADINSIWSMCLLDGEERIDIGVWDNYFSAMARAIFEDAEYGKHTAESLGLDTEWWCNIE